MNPKALLRFSIREMLLLTTLVGVGFAWLIDRQSLKLEIEAESRKAYKWRSEVLDTSGELDRLRQQLFIPFGEPLPPPPSIE